LLVALTQQRIVDAALVILRRGGLAALSMRQIAAELAVAPGALYWHVKSKQDLLALIADRIVATTADQPSSNDPRQLALALRTALLTVRDGAEIVSFAQALQPQSRTPLAMFREVLASTLSEQHAEWGARTLTHFILGAVAEEQNQAELIRVGILTDADRGDYSVDAFLFGIDAITAGLCS
jgi:AcrR family transcriptional regulator